MVLQFGFDGLGMSLWNLWLSSAAQKAQTAQWEKDTPNESNRLHRIFWK